MKMIKLITTALVASAFTVGAYAATPVSSDEGLNKIGSVSVSGPFTLSELEQKLAQKAEEAGASSYRIVTASGNDTLSGVATIYE